MRIGLVTAVILLLVVTPAAATTVTIESISLGNNGYFASWSPGDGSPWVIPIQALGGPDWWRFEPDLYYSPAEPTCIYTEDGYIVGSTVGFVEFQDADGAWSTTSGITGCYGFANIGMVHEVVETDLAVLLDRFRVMRIQVHEIYGGYTEEVELQFVQAPVSTDAGSWSALKARF